MGSIVRLIDPRHVNMYIYYVDEGRGLGVARALVSFVDICINWLTNKFKRNNSESSSKPLRLVASREDPLTIV